MAVLLAESAGAIIWFLLPRFGPGDFGGLFRVPLGAAPPPGGPPVDFAAGRFWLVNLDEADATDPRHPLGYASRPGVVALYKVCVHLGCLYQWRETDNRFSCPCHGSKFLKDGTRIHKPATRDLDRFAVRAIDERDNVLASASAGETEEGGLMPLVIPPGTAALEIDTGRRALGRRNDGPNTVS